MSSTPTPKAVEPHKAQIAPAEQLARAHEQIKRAGEDLARLSEQVTKMERDAARSLSVGRSLPRRPALKALLGLPLAACVVVAALVLQSSYDGGTKPVFAGSATESVSTPTLEPENAPLAAQQAPSIIQVAAAEAAPPQATPPQAAPLDQSAPRDTELSTLRDQAQLLQAMAREIADIERNMEQLKANQQQTASENSKAIEELKTSQEEIKRVLARLSEQNPPKASPPPQATTTLHRPERSLQPPRARERPRSPRERFYDDEW
jgi:hypothetical protein